MIKSEFESGKSHRYGAFYQLGKLFYNLLRIFVHIVLDPVEHQPDQYIRIDLRNKLLIFVSNRYPGCLLVNNIQKQLIHQRLYVFINLLSVNATVNIQNKRLVFLHRFKNL